MANYYERARTSYFAVKDAEKFREWIESLPGNNGIVEDTAGAKKVAGVDPNTPLYAIIFDEESGVPSWRTVARSVHGEDEGETDDQEIDIASELSEHLADGWVAEIRAIGYEKMRYLVGWSLIVNSVGETKTLNLNDIDPANLGPHSTSCEY